MGRVSRVAGGAVLLLIVIAAWLWTRAAPTSGEPHSAPVAQAVAASEVPAYSNVRPEDYVGPKVCGECHEERYRQWEGNLHRRMNRLASEPGAVLGDFSQARVSYAGGEAVFGRRGGDHTMSFERAGKIYRRYRITRTIGARYMQEYVGIQEVGPEPEGHEVYTTEIRLPFGFLLSQERWLHQQYFDSWHGAEYDEAGAMQTEVFDPEQSPWRGRCAWCHNTYAFDKRLARLQGPTQVGSGIELLYVDRGNNAGAKIEGNLLPVDDLVSVGISCESCHFGGREHAVNGKPIRFEPAGAGIERNSQAPQVSGERSDSRTINAICAQCHSTPTKLYPNGAGTRNSSEALDLLSGACASKIKCTDCHDPHVPGPGALADDQPTHLAACLGCHQNYAETERAQEHSRHDAEVSCLDCHMPRMVQGVDELLRSHRISSPSDAEMLATSLNACNLCHLDRSVAWTENELVNHYGFEASDARPDERPAFERWIASDVRIHRLTAAEALGYSNNLGAQFLGALLRRLDDPVAYDRMRYLWAIEEIVGRDLSPEEFDATASPDIRRAQVKALQLRGNAVLKARE